jgi:hypothetical protein
VAKVRVIYGLDEFGDVVVEVLVKADDEVDAKLGRYGSIFCDCEAGKRKASRAGCPTAGELFVSIDAAEVVESGNVLEDLFFSMVDRR